jgi:putative nucleotidyltransferase with HDIG domain
MGNVRVHPLLKEIASIFASENKKAYLVGGAVRDMLRGATPGDWDIATDATPEEVIRLFKRVIPTGIKHGTVTILYKGRSIEATTFRTESTYSDGRRPDTVRFAATIEEDLSRRDFTMNAIAVELPGGRIVDPFGGERDIASRIIRCVGDPTERFGEDGLRPLRATRFASQLGFDFDPPTLRAIPEALGKTAMVAVERLRDEIDKMLASEKPSIGLAFMEKTGLLALILPELASCRGIEQKGFHRFDVLDHLFLSCDGAPKDRPIVRLAALLHDIGKPLVRALGEDGIWTFYRHEEESARLARDILTRLRYPTAKIEAVVHLIAVHMFHYEETWSDAAVRRFVVRVGEETLADLYALRRADTYGTTGVPPPPGAGAPLAERVERVLAVGRALSIRDLAVTGDDLASIGVPRGPRMGRLLKELLETVLDDPAMNDKGKLLEVVHRLEKRRTDERG